MDTYHKILVRILELSGGRDTVDVDLTDLLRKEGYLPSRDEICEMLKSEGWVTESRPNVVRITHWGVAEAKKAGTAKPGAVRATERESRRLLAETREFAVVIEEFIADPSDTHRIAMAKKFAELNGIYERLNEL
jgi:hypothetical protein